MFYDRPFPFLPLKWMLMNIPWMITHKMLSRNFYHMLERPANDKHLILPISCLLPGYLHIFFSSLQDPPSEHGSPSCASTTKLLPSRREVPDSPASLASSRSPTPLKTKEPNLVSRAVNWQTQKLVWIIFRTVVPKSFNTGTQPKKIMWL